MIQADHPALPGHFPGQPLVPGVVIVDQVMTAFADKYPDRVITGIRKLKFLQPLLPDQPVTVALADIKGDRVRFQCLRAGVVIAEGNLTLM